VKLDLAATVAASRAAQGRPERITDPATLAAMARVLAEPTTSPQTAKTA
jgi:hypothetical protein